MIFVTVGNHNQGFERLIKKMDEIAGKINEKVIMQIGDTDYLPVNAEYFNYKDSFEEIIKLNRDARVIVSHAGVGSMLTALEQKKPVIMVPRLKKYNEHLDDHQLEIVKGMSDNPNIKPVYDIEELERCIMQDFAYREQRSNNSKLVDSLKNYLSSN